MSELLWERAWREKPVIVSDLKSRDASRWAFKRFEYMRPCWWPSSVWEETLSEFISWAESVRVQSTILYSWEKRIASNWECWKTLRTSLYLSSMIGSMVGWLSCLPRWILLKNIAGPQRVAVWEISWDPVSIKTAPYPLTLSKTETRERPRMACGLSVVVGTWGTPTHDASLWLCPSPFSTPNIWAAQMETSL